MEDLNYPQNNIHLDEENIQEFSITNLFNFLKKIAKKWLIFAVIITTYFLFMFPPTSLLPGLIITFGVFNLTANTGILVELVIRGVFALGSYLCGKVYKLLFNTETQDRNAEMIPADSPAEELQISLSSSHRDINDCLPKKTEQKTAEGESTEEFSADKEPHPLYALKAATLLQTNSENDKLTI